MNTQNEQSAMFERAYQRAQDVIDAEWIATGVTREELAADKRHMEELNRLFAAGLSDEEIEQYFENLSGMHDPNPAELPKMTIKASKTKAAATAR